MIMLTLSPGGHLSCETLDAYEKKHTVEDVTTDAVCFLFYPVQIKQGVLLKDLFLLLNTNLKIFDALFGNWCRDWVTEGLKEGGTLPEGLSSIYLEHHIVIEKIGEKNVLDGVAFPQCYLLRTDGETSSIGSIAPNDLAQLALLLKPDGRISASDLADKSFKELSFNDSSYTLAEIIQGILWELSWFGSPTKTEKFWEEMDSRIEDALEDEKKQ